MPMHDWTRVSAGTYHDLHNAWIIHLKEALNAGVLPEDYYALGEQRAGEIHPDVLALRAAEPDTPLEDEWTSGPTARANLVAVANAPPEVSIHQEAKENIEFYLQRQRTVVVRQTSGDRIVALVEIVSPANKHSRRNLDDFVDKVVSALHQDIHVLVVDPLPPGRFDPAGIHHAIWDSLGEGDYEPPPGRVLTLVSYCVSDKIDAWIEPYAVGDALRDMPLFLTAGHYVLTPLETTYLQSWAGVPQRWKRVIEANG